MHSIWTRFRVIAHYVDPFEGPRTLSRFRKGERQGRNVRTTVPDNHYYNTNRQNMNKNSPKTQKEVKHTKATIKPLKRPETHRNGYKTNEE